jgi:hypothetical protein
MFSPHDLRHRRISLVHLRGVPWARIGASVGVVWASLPLILLRTLRRLPLVNDALLTWLFILGGVALGVVALIAFEGPTLAMFVLSGAEIFRKRDRTLPHPRLNLRMEGPQAALCPANFTSILWSLKGRTDASERRF